MSFSFSDVFATSTDSEITSGSLKVLLGHTTKARALSYITAQSEEASRFQGSQTDEWVDEGEDYEYEYISDFAIDLITAMASSSSNVVGVHYRVGKKIGEGSFGVIFEGTNLLNNQQVAIKFVRIEISLTFGAYTDISRNRARVMPPSSETNTEHTRFLWAAVRLTNPACDYND